MLRTVDLAVDCAWVRRDRLNQFSIELFGLGLDETAAALERIPLAAHREWLDQRLAEQGFVRDADGRLQWPRRDGDDDE